MMKDTTRELRSRLVLHRPLLRLKPSRLVGHTAALTGPSAFTVTVAFARPTPCRMYRRDMFAGSHATVGRGLRRAAWFIYTLRVRLVGGGPVVSFIIP